MKKINIFFLLPRFVLGGAGKSISTLCKNLNKNKFNIFIICLNKCYYANELKRYCNNIYEINSKKTLFAQKKIKKILENKKNEKSILVSNLFYCNVLTALFQKKNRLLKFIFVERTPFQELSIYFGVVDFLKKFVIKFLLKIAYKKSDLVIANSLKTASELASFSDKKTKGIYPPSFQKKNLYKKYQKKNFFNLLTIGRLSQEKGYDTLISIISEINFKNYKLTIVGDGPEKENLKKLVARKKLKKKVFFLGEKKNVNYYFKNSDLFINNSLFEGFPNVVVEALSFGVPVMCSNSHGGIGEILRNGKYGVIYKDQKSLKKQLKIFFKEPQLLQRKALLGQKDLKRFSADENKKAYEKIFLDMKFPI